MVGMADGSGVGSLDGLSTSMPHAPGTSGKHAVLARTGLQPLDKERGTIGRKAADYMRRMMGFTRRGDWVLP
jgi:hypothetical protein